jgi:hypothetical protein
VIGLGLLRQYVIGNLLFCGYEVTIEELKDLDGLEFEGHAVTNAPSVLLHKGNSSV